MKNKHQGFTLFEVLISMFIAGVAVLGLVALELNILRSSQSSFNYTLATIEANSLIDKTWQSLCFIEEGTAAGPGTPASPATQSDKDSKYRANAFIRWQDRLSTSVLNSSTFTGVTALSLSNGVGTFALNDSIIVSWSNDKSAESITVTSLSSALNTNNAVVLNASYPDFTGGCK